MNTCHSAIELQAGEKNVSNIIPLPNVSTSFIDFKIVYEVIFEVFNAEGCQWVKKQIFSLFSFKYKYLIYLGNFASTFFCQLGLA